MASLTEIKQWAQGIGLGDCVGIAFHNQFGRLPSSIPELESWGNSTGRRSGQSWSCKTGDDALKTGSPAAAAAPTAVSGGPTSSAPAATAGGVGAWLQSGNNMLYVILGVGAYVLLGRR